jgi:hypothetical protein
VHNAIADDQEEEGDAIAGCREEEEEDEDAT